MTANNFRADRRTLTVTSIDNVEEPSTQLEECHINQVE